MRESESRLFERFRYHVDPRENGPVSRFPEQELQRHGRHRHGRGPAKNGSERFRKRSVGHRTGCHEIHGTADGIHQQRMPEARRGRRDVSSVGPLTGMLLPCPTQTLIP